MQTRWHREGSSKKMKETHGFHDKNITFNVLSNRIRIDENEYRLRMVKRVRLELGRKLTRLQTEMQNRIRNPTQTVEMSALWYIDDSLAHRHILSLIRRSFFLLAYADFIMVYVPTYQSK